MDTNEMVNHPSHYQGLEVIDAMELAYGTSEVMAFCRCNWFKYRARAGKKGNAQTDLEKAQWYARKFQQLRKKIGTKDEILTWGNDLDIAVAASYGRMQYENED